MLPYDTTEKKLEVQSAIKCKFLVIVASLALHHLGGTSPLLSSVIPIRYIHTSSGIVFLINWPL